MVLNGVDDTDDEDDATGSGEVTAEVVAADATAAAAGAVVAAAVDEDDDDDEDEATFAPAKMNVGSDDDRRRWDRGFRSANDGACGVTPPSASPTGDVIEGKEGSTRNGTLDAEACSEVNDAPAVDAGPPAALVGASTDVVVDVAVVVAVDLVSDAAACDVASVVGDDDADDAVNGGETAP